MKLKHLLFSALMLLSAGTAWADVEINETNFPDANFRSWVLSQNYGNDGVLTDEEIAGVFIMDVSSKEIQSLQGIEYFTALYYLSCNNNQLTSLDVSKCGVLTILVCWNNQLTSLDVSKNTALTMLSCGNNQLTMLDVSKNTKLTELRCYDNQLTSLDVSKNTALTDLICNGNQLTSLDVSGCTALTDLDCYGNQLTSLDAFGCTALTDLDCNSNQLTLLDVSGCTELEDLSCGNNQLTMLDVSKNKKLGSLSCYQNKIKGDAMDALVESLHTLSRGMMSNGKVSGGIFIIYNENEQNVMTNSQLFAARAKGWFPKVYDGSKWKNAIDNIPINSEFFPDANFRSYLLGRSEGSDGVLTDEEIVEMRHFVFSDYAGIYDPPIIIQSLQGIEYFYGLTYLTCENNQLTSINLMGNTSIIKVFCSGNQLTKINVSGNTSLEYMYCSSNQLASLDMSGCTDLRHLACSSNQLTSLDVSGCKRLTEIYCYQNKIKGKSMDALIESLPTVSSGKMYVTYYENEQNIMTTTQVAAAKTKGWIPYYTDGTTNPLGLVWYEYPGIDPSTGVNNVKAEAADSAPWYTINGTLLTGKPTAPGIYIHYGKKVFVK